MATTEQFSLRWNNFHSNLTSGFHELLEAADMVDVTLAVDGHVLQAHKIVLSICSPYFKQMFRVNPCKHPIVILKDIGHENMKDILEFMYMGEVSVLRENLTTFLRTAEMLQVKGLTGDDSSDTSSRKDDRLDCDIEEEEISQYNQMLETDMELPHQYSSSKVSPQTISQQPTIGNKRVSKGSLPSANKRPKSETHQNKRPTNLPEEVKKTDYTSEMIDCNSLNSTVIKSELDDGAKDSLKLVWENNIGPSSTDAGTEQDNLMYSGDNKGHVFCPYCCRKFVNRYNLKVHIRDKHEDNSTDLDCSVCGKTMRNQSCLRVHMYHHRKQQLETPVP